MMDPKKIKLVIFDIDGTLLNTDNLVIHGYEHLFELYRPDYHLTDEERISFLGPTLKEKFAEYFDGDFKTLVDEYHAYTDAHAKEQAYVYPHGVEALEHLKKQGYHLAVITSRLNYAMDFMLNTFEIRDYFDFFVTINDVKKPKPDPEGMKLCLEHFNLNPDEAIYFGDNESDYKAARGAGVFISLVDWAPGRDNSLLKPDLLLHSYQDIIDLFNK